MHKNNPAAAPGSGNAAAEKSHETAVEAGEQYRNISRTSMAPERAERGKKWVYPSGAVSFVLNKTNRWNAANFLHRSDWAYAHAEHHSVKAGPAAVLGYLAFRWTPTGGCFPSIVDIAAGSRLKRSTIIGHVETLVAKGLVEVVERYDATGARLSNRFHLAFEFDPLLSDGHRVDSAPPRPESGPSPVQNLDPPRPEKATTPVQNLDPNIVEKKKERTRGRRSVASVRHRSRSNAGLVEKAEIIEFRVGLIRNGKPHSAGGITPEQARELIEAGHVSEEECRRAGLL